MLAWIKLSKTKPLANQNPSMPFYEHLQKKCLHFIFFQHSSSGSWYACKMPPEGVNSSQRLLRSPKGLGLTFWWKWALPVVCTQLSMPRNHCAGKSGIVCTGVPHQGPLYGTICSHMPKRWCNLLVQNWSMKQIKSYDKWVFAASNLNNGKMQESNGWALYQTLHCWQRNEHSSLKQPIKACAGFSGFYLGTFWIIWWQGPGSLGNTWEPCEKLEGAAASRRERGTGNDKTLGLREF